jgi:hypothetical protein
MRGRGGKQGDQVCALEYTKIRRNQVQKCNFKAGAFTGENPA